ncbi:YdeI/OmpD-associated family protein [Microbacterium sp. JZ31]|uniref:YdeI/OmpD-associated family protein n=1 Tax=Microbacterium sp. JZ31 TaxID=1906274 RepID=UPI0019318DE9|nr:YdeI/OmpD-associated family protein [Microbacterium sp. JZ31]
MGALTLSTTIRSYGPAAAILLTEDQIAQLGRAKSPPVVVTIGERRARLRVGRMGGDILIGFSKAARAELGIEAGDEVEARIELDAAERAVEVPDELAAALDAEPGLREAFDALAYSRRKEAARSVAEAKQDATRERRIAKVLESLRG